MSAMSLHADLQFPSFTDWAGRQHFTATGSEDFPLHQKPRFWKAAAHHGTKDHERMMTIMCTKNFTCRCCLEP